MIRILGIGLIAYLLFELQRQLYYRLWKRGLLVQVKFSSAYIFEGETGELLEVIENHKWLPLSMLKVKFQTSRNLVFANTQKSGVTDRYYRNDVFQIGGGERITRTLRFVGRKRGYYLIHGIDLISADLFLTSEMMDSREGESFLYVYPRPFFSRELQVYLQQINGEILAKKNLAEDPFEYRGIREYQPYDDIRSVNWKATAKGLGLMANQKGYTTRQTVRIFFNVEDSGILKKEEAVEYTFRVAAGIARFFLTQGVKVSLMGNGMDMFSHEPVKIEAMAGSGQMDNIYRALARIDTELPAADFTETFREDLFAGGEGTQTFFISPNGYDNFMEVMGQYHTKGWNYQWFYPVWEQKDPVVPDWVRGNTRIIHIRG